MSRAGRGKRTLGKGAKQAHRDNTEEEEGTVYGPPYTSTPFGLAFRQAADSRIELFLQFAEEQFTWVQEVLVEAKRSFATETIQLLPKTPSSKRCRRGLRRRKSRISTDGKQDEETGKRASKRLRGSKRLKAQLFNADQSNGDSTSDDTGCSDGSARSTRSTRSTRSSSSSQPSARTTRSTRAGRNQADETTISPKSVLFSTSQLSVRETITEESEPESDNEDNTDRAKEAKEDKNTIDSRASEPMDAVSETDSEMEVDKSKHEVSEKMDSTMEVDQSTAEVSKKTHSETEVTHAIARVPELSAVKNSDDQHLLQNSKVNSPSTSNHQSPSTRHSQRLSPTKAIISPKLTHGYRHLNVKEKAKAYEVYINHGRSHESPLKSDSDHSSPETKPRPLRNSSLSVKVDTVLGKSPRTPNSIPDTPQTPPTIIQKSKATITLSTPEATADHHSETQNEKIRVLPKEIATALRDSGEKVKNDYNRKSSLRRVSSTTGRRLSAARRRSSLSARQKLRSSNRLSQSLCKKAKQMLNSSLAHVKTSSPRKNASPSSPRTVRLCHLKGVDLQKEINRPVPARTTRSKMRACKTQQQVEVCSMRSTRSKMRKPPSDEEESELAPQRTTRSKMRHVKQSSSETDEEKTPVIKKCTVNLIRQTPSRTGGPGTPASSGYASRDGQTPSTAAPMRSTRSKMRQWQQACHSPSLVEFKKPATVLGSGPQKRRMLASADREEASSKRRCSEEDYSSNSVETHYEISKASSEEHLDRNRMTPLHHSSFLHGLTKKPSNVVTVATSFIQKAVVVNKPSPRELLLQQKQKLAQKSKQEELRTNHRRELLRMKTEERKKRNEERQLLAARRREEMEKRNMESQKGLLHKLEDKKALQIQEEKQKERERQRQMREQKMVEAEQRRKHEEEARLQKLQEQENEKKRQEEYHQRKREYEETERQKRLIEQKKREEERKAELERERQREQVRLAELEEQRQLQEHEKQRQKEDRERRERMDRERLELDRQAEKERQKIIALEKQRELEKIRIKEELVKKQARLEEEKLAREEERRAMLLIEKHNQTLKVNMNVNNAMNKTTANTTITKSTADNNKTDDDIQSYEITPAKKYKQPSVDNYDITDLKSDDSTDEEDAPRKKLPKWAQGSQLKAALINQYYQPPDLDVLFDIIEPPDLNLIFKKKKARFNKRTSSAMWDSPIMKASGKPQDEV